MRRFQANEPILARPVSTRERLWRWCQRNPSIAGLSGAVAALLVIVALVSIVAAVRFEGQRQIAEGHATEAEIARGKAEDARNAEAEARLLADKNAAIAHEQADLALETLSSLLIAVRENLKDTPGTQRLREAFARNALDKLHKIAPRVESVALTSISRAEAHRFMGTIYVELGQIGEARPHFEQCHAILKKLAAAKEASQRDLTVAYNALGDYALLVGDRVTARAHYQTALAERRAAFQADGDSVRAKVDLATSCVKLGNACDAKEALALYEEGWRLRQELADAHPANAAYGRDVVIAANRLGDVQLRLGDTKAALDWYQIGLGRAERVQKTSPRSNTALQTLAQFHEKLGLAQRQVNAVAVAEQHFNKALELLQPLGKDDPENLALQAELALLLARSGRQVEASPKALALLKLAPKYANNLYNVACCFAQCAGAVTLLQPQSGLSPQLQTQRQRYADASFKLIDEAIAQGFGNRHLLNTDPDLDPIRTEPKFGGVLKKLP